MCCKLAEQALLCYIGNAKFLVLVGFPSLSAPNPGHLMLRKCWQQQTEQLSPGASSTREPAKRPQRRLKLYEAMFGLERVFGGAAVNSPELRRTNSVSRRRRTDE